MKMMMKWKRMTMMTMEKAMMTMMKTKLRVAQKGLLRMMTTTKMRMTLKRRNRKPTMTIKALSSCGAPFKPFPCPNPLSAVEGCVVIISRIQRPCSHTQLQIFKDSNKTSRLYLLNEIL
ncbi:hypothetical protein ANANG_G00123680 [Anguilla anguilla]|uniref:Uncharacterized protein n=1 Tax=Anguilla anguilla TaxID=7936 RepID=A0A0E9WVZ9_ANGAN|nr:hypothetical protein ANANG_G00123680 [Anguilla anguilla]